MKTSGKEKRTLSTGWTGVSGVPCWTPDGREIWITGSQTVSAHAIYAIDRAGKRRLVTRVPGSLELDDISRDGRVLVAHHTFVRILAVGGAGQEKERDLSWLDRSEPADLSPDGKTILFTETGEGSGGKPAVYLRRTDGSPALRLGEGTALALGPDGKLVLAVVSSGATQSENLVLLPTGVGESRTLANERMEDFGGGAWLPDGKRIVFAAREKGHPAARIYVQNLDGGLPRPLTPEGTWIRRVMRPVSPDGKLLLVAEQGPRTWIYPVEGGAALPIVGLEPEEFPFQWSSDGHSLYVHKHLGIPNKVWLLDPSSGARKLWREITPSEAAVGLRQMLVAPDGKTYAYGSQRTLSELYVVEGLK